jgi:hypothetical protein
LEGRGQSDCAQRRAAAARGELPSSLVDLVAKIHDCAWKITDEDVAAARRAGWTDDQLFEVMAAASLGASLERLNAGLCVLAQAREEELP